MPIKVFNTLTGGKEDFIPLEKGKVRMYVCGPTVYDLSHIGHARSAVSFDVVYRYLRYSGYDVVYTRNYTDIDDKIINRANKDGVNWKDLAERYIEAYNEDMAALFVEKPTHTPRATETIKEMIDLIGTLIKKGYAYVMDGDVFYSVRKFVGYGKLSGKNIEELESGARVAVDENKDDPLDFALWKKSKANEPSWESPWGQGRPGWHIECSAMCLEKLGETLDIHGGGKDLIFPHHENEIAQSETATGKPFVRYWLHNGFVNIEKEKMSKSLGNILNIRDALKAHTPESVRLFLLSSHYRSPIDYSGDSLKEAEAKAERFYRTVERMEEEWPEILKKKAAAGVVKKRMRPIIEAMDDDFNTAGAIGIIFEEVAGANRMMDGAKKDKLTEELPVVRAVFKEASKFLGVFSSTHEEYFAKRKKMTGLPAKAVERLIKEREEARKKKDFKRADEIRDELKRQGIILEDTDEGTKWTGTSFHF
ncbi:MAG: cysteine--tRNA ligase [Deltaproteobacteria bacterium]|nr:cysteine--tRNA ligase [Deltaproteobacteria bacterium]